MTYGVPEFMDTYSDDLIYIEEGKEAVLNDTTKLRYEKVCIASFCRIYAVMMIGGLESLFNEWKEEDKFGILSSYFTDGLSNEKKVESLFNAFLKAKIQVDREIFNDYLAIKYLRNIIVHSKWKDSEKEWLEERGFPGDTRELTNEHWGKMRKVSKEMINYVILLLGKNLVRSNLR